MKLLFLDSPSFGKYDMISAFEKQGIEVHLFKHDKLRDYLSKEFDVAFDAFIQNTGCTIAFSFNYFPALSNGCKRNQMKYLAFVYDNPLVSLYSYTIINPCNYIFLFDKATFIDFIKIGVKTVCYLPLCANTDRLSALVTPPHALSNVSSDVAFVGSLYNEKHNFFDRMTDLDDYTKGYLDGIMNAQRKINGYYFIEEVLTPHVITAMKNSLKFSTQPGGTESDSYLCAYYFIARKISALERHDILATVSEHFQTKLYTHNPTPDLPYIQNMGAVDYYDVMPHIFKNSKINLNITLRSIRSGIPLRAFDIMGANGFLLTNYQEDFLDYFTPDEDFVFFDGTDDLISKIEYYLSHEKERKEIAQNGFQKITNCHTYEHRVRIMLEIANLNDSLS